MPKIKDTSHKSHKRSRKGVPPKSSTMLDEEGNELFNVEYIFGKKYDPREQDYRYLVKWDGFPKKDSTWEPIDHLISVEATLKEYNLIHGRSLFGQMFLPRGTKLFKDAITQSREPSLERPGKERKEVENTLGKEENKEKNEKNCAKEVEKNGHVEEKKEIVVFEKKHGIQKQQDLGDFKRNLPKRVVKHRNRDNTDSPNALDGVYYKIEWELEGAGLKPKSRYYDIEDLKVYCPQLLIEYLQEHAVLKEKSEEF